MAGYDFKKETIFIDTNVVFESYRLNIWNAISKSYRLGTVEKVIEECTRNPRKYDKKTIEIDDSEIRSSFKVIERATRKQRANLAVKCNLDIDDGEKYLIAYLLAQSKTSYFICTADFAAIRAGFELNMNHNFVSLEKLASELRLKKRFYSQYTEKILSMKKTEFLIDITS